MAYNRMGKTAAEFMDHGEIERTLAAARELAKDEKEVKRIIHKASGFGGLTHEEASVLSFVEDKELIEEMFRTARDIKKPVSYTHLYGTGRAALQDSSSRQRGLPQAHPPVRRKRPS